VHSVLAVEGEIHDHLLELAFVYPYPRREIAGQGEVPVLTHQPADDRLEIAYRGAEVEDLGPMERPATEREELARHCRGAFGRAHNVPDLGQPLLPHVRSAQQELAEPEDD
jgi:hypothetical protein